jgi:hypothetical protein
LHVDDELGLFEAAAQTGILFPQALVFLRQRIGCGLASALLGSQGIEFPLLLLAAPGCQVGRIQPLAAEQGADGAVVAARLGLRHYRTLVLGSELPALGLLRNLRVGDRDRRGAANSACLTGNCLRFDLSTELDSFSALYSN